MTVSWDGRVANDGSPRLVFIDREKQALWVEVGDVFIGGKLHHEPGVWIWYQPQYLNSQHSGPILMSPRTWTQLATAVQGHLTRSTSRRIRRRVRSLGVRHLRARTRTRVS